MIELTIIIKDESVRYQEKHLIYEPVLMALQSEDLKSLVEAAFEKFTGDKSDPDIVVKTKMCW